MMALCGAPGTREARPAAVRCVPADHATAFGATAQIKDEGNRGKEELFPKGANERLIPQKNAQGLWVTLSAHFLGRIFGCLIKSLFSSNALRALA